MAKLTLSLLLLFFVVAFSESRTPSDLPKDDVSGRDLPSYLPDFEADSAATILLPSEKPESEAATVVQTDPATAATDSSAQDAADIPVADEWPALEAEKSAVIASVPLRTVTFRPYDHRGFHERTVPLSLRFPFRHGGRGCRHGHRQFRPRFQGREISYGNDMILSDEKSGSDPESRGIERQMPGRWIRVHHRKPRFGFVDVAWKEVEDMEMMKRPEHHEEREGDEEREHHHRRWKKDGDMMKRPDRHEEREGDEDREHHHRLWNEAKDMMKRPHRHEEHEGDEDREHHHRIWKEDKDMMKRPHRPEEDEDREHHHHRHHHHHFRHHHDHDDEEERHGGEGIFKRIRKFLNHF